jgi:hypothetical protein
MSIESPFLNASYIFEEDDKYNSSKGKNMGSYLAKKKSKPVEKKKKKKSQDRGLLDCLVFSENNILYTIFVCFINLISLISSYIYLFMAAFRSDPPDYFPAMWNAMIIFESIFLVYVIL